MWQRSKRHKRSRLTTDLRCKTGPFIGQQLQSLVGLYLSRHVQVAQEEAKNRQEEFVREIKKWSHWRGKPNSLVKDIRYGLNQNLLALCTRPCHPEHPSTILEKKPEGEATTICEFKNALRSIDTPFVSNLKMHAANEISRWGS